MKTVAFLAVMACAAPGMAACPEGMELMFRCSIVERNAEVELCHGGGRIHYAYATDGKPELEFTGPAWGGMKSRVQGIHGHAYGSAAQHGDMFYAVFVERGLMNFEPGGPEWQSPNPAVVQVYGSSDDFTAFDTDRPVARRVCYPPSIRLDDSNFGPG